MTNVAMSPAFARRAAGFLLLALTFGITAGCGTTHKRPLRERMEEFMRPYEELKRQKADLWRVGWKPQVFEFEDQGTVTVRRWELAGWPGDVYVKTKITYENTTDQPRAFAFVWLDVLDADDQVVGTTAVRLVNPFGYAFWPGHSYTTELQARTNGVHLDPRGWGWTIACEAPVESEPGVQPVLINHDLEAARAEEALRFRERYYYQRTPLLIGPHVPGVTRW